jgi:hypothetical protein
MNNTAVATIIWWITELTTNLELSFIYMIECLVVSRHVAIQKFPNT